MSAVIYGGLLFETIYRATNTGVPWIELILVKALAFSPWVKLQYKKKLEFQMELTGTAQGKCGVADGDHCIVLLQVYPRFGCAAIPGAFPPTTPPYVLFFPPANAAQTNFRSQYFLLQRLTVRVSINFGCRTQSCLRSLHKT